MKIGFASDRGLVRENNEDRYFIHPEGDLFVVADGAGGHLAGEKAAQIVIDVVSREVIATIGAGELCYATELLHARTSLVEAIRQANKAVIEAAEKNSEWKGMCSTVVAAFFVQDTLYVANVGDSRAYLIRDEDIRRLTEDHSLEEQMVLSGKMPRGQARHLRNILTRAVGAHPEIHVDIQQFQFRDGNYLLLCTDGLSDMVEQEEIKRTVLNAKNPQKACDLLIEKANKRGGFDNTTIIIVNRVDYRVGEV